MLLVDSSVWADFYNGHLSPPVEHLRDALEGEVDIAYTGFILQEILQGIRQPKIRVTLRHDFEPFILLEPTLDTYVQAAEVFAKCRAKGVTVRSSIDCLLATIAMEYDLALLHKDRDFALIAKISPLKLA